MQKQMHSEEIIKRIEGKKDVMVTHNCTAKRRSLSVLSLARNSIPFGIDSTVFLLEFTEGYSCHSCRSYLLLLDVNGKSLMPLKNRLKH